MTNSTLYKTLTICAVTAFIVIVGSYAIYSSNPISSRVHFGLFMSLIPALITVLAFRWTTLRRSRTAVVLVYVVDFVLLYAAWGAMEYFGRG